nr:MAG TPA: hypothetical protein [Caudoviricetes sp.]
MRSLEIYFLLFFGLVTTVVLVTILSKIKSIHKNRIVDIGLTVCVIAVFIYLVIAAYLMKD